MLIIEIWVVGISTLTLKIYLRSIEEESWGPLGEEEVGPLGEAFLALYCR